MIKVKKSKKGNILSIVLVLFLILVNFISIYLNKLTMDIDNYAQIKLLLKEKNLEILLTKYYIDTEYNDILFSDEYENDEVAIEYSVEINEYEDVETTINFIKEDITYKWILSFDSESYIVKRCNYE